MIIKNFNSSRTFSYFIFGYLRNIFLASKQNCEARVFCNFNVVTIIAPFIQVTR